MTRFLDKVLGPGWAVLLLFMIKFLLVTSANETTKETSLGINLVNVTTLGTTSFTLAGETTVPSTSSDTTIDNVPDIARGPGQRNSTEPVPKANANSMQNTSTDTVPTTSTEPVQKTTPCKVLVGIDEPLYENYYSKNMTKVVDSVNHIFEQINQIYNQKVFTGDLGGIYFKVTRIQVMFSSCDAKKNKKCTHQIMKFLDIFEQYDFNEFCLAYMFTFRSDNGVVGLARTPGLCRKEHNFSGIITFLYNNVARDINDTVITLAHELGHSMGAPHDNKVGCGSGLIMQGGSYTLFGYIFSPAPHFSSCSVARMQDNIHAVMASEENCLLKEEEETLELETALCGNYGVEPGEECDCGDNLIACNDLFHISPWERQFNQSAQPCNRTSRVQCEFPTSRPAWCTGSTSPWPSRPWSSSVFAVAVAGEDPRLL